MRKTTLSAVAVMTRAVIVGLALAGPVAGCSRGTAPDEPSAERTPEAGLLVGGWDLVRGCGGIAGRCLTPDALIEPTRYVFRADGMVEAYRDGALRFTTNYQLVPPPPNDPDGRSVLMIGFGPAIDPRPLFVRFPDADTLVLDEGCCDRFSFEYRRAR
jgi:hypothetical protein